MQGSKRAGWQRAICKLYTCNPAGIAPDPFLLACRGPLTDKEREERRLRKELDKAERLLSKHQAREDKETVKNAIQEEREKAREVTRRNASRMAMDDLQVKPYHRGSWLHQKSTSVRLCQRVTPHAIFPIDGSLKLQSAALPVPSSLP